MPERIANVSNTVLTSAITTTAQTTFTVFSTASFPTLTPFRIIIDNEYMTVTAMTGTTWTVTRQSEDSGRFPATSHASGAVVTHVLTAGGLSQLIADTIGNVVSGALITASGVAQAIPWQATTVMNYAAIVFDTGPYWTSNSPNRLTVPATDWYLIGGQVSWSSNNNQGRVIELRINGGTYLYKQSHVSPAHWDAPDMTTFGAYYMTINDYLEMTVFQSGGNPTLNTVDAKLWVRRF